MKMVKLFFSINFLHLMRILTNYPAKSTIAQVLSLGLLWNQALLCDRLTLRLDYEILFIDLKDKGNNAQEQGFYFSLRYQP